MDAVGVVRRDQRPDQRREENQGDDEESCEGGGVAAQLIDEVAEAPDHWRSRSDRSARSDKAALVDRHVSTELADRAPRWRCRGPGRSPWPRRGQPAGSPEWPG